MSTYDELEIGLHRLADGAYQVEVRSTRPDSVVETAPRRGQARFDFLALLKSLEDPRQYGEQLTEQLFSDPVVRSEYQRASNWKEARSELLRVRLLIDDSAAELHALRWELLRDPETGSALATSERVLFSRLLDSQEWRNVELRSRASLRALVAVSAPHDITEYQGMAAVDREGEVARARTPRAGRFDAGVAVLSSETGRKNSSLDAQGAASPRRSLPTRPRPMTGTVYSVAPARRFSSAVSADSTESWHGPVKDHVCS